MQCLSGPQTASGRAWGVSLRELAAAGQPPVVLQDCLRWLALRGLTAPRLFAGAPRSEERKLLALRHLYDTGRRPLRSKSCRDKDPHLIASLLLLWLRALPEPLFPAALVPELVQSQQSDYYDERVAAVRALLKRAEPFVVEALFPLFELLHHYWINQADRDSCLQELGRLLAPAVFGTAIDHGLPPEDGGLLSDTVEMLISEYRPLFTQPFNLRRYEADAARQAAAAAAQQAEAQRSEAAAAAAPLSSPLLTPIRCERLSVMAPEGASPFSDCCGTPLPASPVSLFLAAAMQTSGSGGAPAGVSPPFSPMASEPRQQHVAVGFASLQRVPGSFSGFGAYVAAAEDGLCTPPPEEDVHDAHLEQAFSDLLESTVSAMLFDVPLVPAQQGADAGAGADVAACSDGLDDMADMLGSPVGVLREMVSDGGDSTDGSDCDAPMASANSHPFAWPRSAAARSIATC